MEIQDIKPPKIVEGTVQIIAWLEGSFVFYIKYPLFYFEIIDQQAISFANPFGSKGKEWKNIGFSWNKRNYRAIDVFVNGETVQSTQLSESNWLFSQLERESTNDGKLLFGRMEELPFESRTIEGLQLMDFVLWNRYVNHFEGHRFLGISGIFSFV